MTGARRVAADIGIGATVAIAAISVRRVRELRRRDRGLPVGRSRRARKIERARARAAARWVRDNGELTRALLTTSEQASSQLSMCDNARRTGEAYLDSAGVVEASLAAGSAATIGSTAHALRTKIADLRSDAAPYLHAASSAQHEVARLQIELQAQQKRLAAEAPRQLVDVTRRLVAAHERARLPVPGRLDEVRAQQRTAELAALRESLEQTVDRLRLR